MRTISRTVDLAKMCRVENLVGVAFTSEQGGHCFEISAVRDGVPEAITGSITGRFIRPGGTSVQITPSYCDIQDGKAYVTLPGNCYTEEGLFTLVVFNIAGDDPSDTEADRTVIYSCAGYIRPGETSTIVDPESVINVDAIQGMIDDMQDATADAEAASAFVTGIIAPEYSARSTYQLGEFVTKDGGMYCCKTPITTAEAWNGEHWEQVLIGTELDALQDADKAVHDEIFDEVESPASWSIGNWSSTGGTAGTNNKRVRTALPTISGLDYTIKADRGVLFFPLFYDGTTYKPASGYAWRSECHLASVAPEGATGFRLTVRTDPEATLTNLVEETGAKIHFLKPVKANADQGVANAGKAMIVGQDGIIAPGVSADVAELQAAMPMRGKVIVNFGDSIFGHSAMRGQTSGAASESISHMVSVMTGATCHIAAFGGTHAVHQSNTSPVDFDNLVTAITGYNPDWTEVASWPDWSAQDAFAQAKSETYYSWIQALKAIDFANDVDIVTIAYGTNDFSSQVTPAAFETSITNSVQRLMKRFPNLLVVLCTPIIRFIRQGGDPDADAEDSGGDSGGSGDVISSDDYESSRAHAHLYEFAEKVEAVGRALHCPVCENYWSLGINTLNYSTFMGGTAASDLVHPNAKGRRLIANHLVAELNRL